MQGFYAYCKKCKKEKGLHNDCPESNPTTTEPAWKEQLRKYAAANLNDGEYPIPENGRMVQLEYAVETMIDGISEQVVKKIIDEIPDEYGANKVGYGITEKSKAFKQSLRDRFL